MKAIFGVLSLLVVLAIVGSLGARLLQTDRSRAPGVSTQAGAALPAGGTPAEQSQQLQRKAADDVNRLMQQAPARLQGAEP